MEHRTVYANERSYSAFPDVKLLQNGDLVIVFREAQRRTRLTHTDSTSRATLVRSLDGGYHWDAVPPVTVAQDGPDIGIQDPSIAQLRDGTLISNFFKWQVYRDEPYGAEGLGSFITRSFDNGYTWEQQHHAVGRPEGVGAWVSTTDAVLELPAGELLIPVYENNSPAGEQGGHRAFLMKSTDKGESWQPWGMIGYDPFGNHHFEEPALLYLPSGKLICLLREDKRKECAWQADSWDGGQTWSIPRRLPVWGHPQHLVRLQSGRLLLTYGYRRPPYGVRACISNDEGTTWDLAHERVLRADGVNTDLGYPSSVQLADGRILTAYYWHEPGENGLRTIAATIYEEW